MHRFTISATISALFLLSAGCGADESSDDSSGDGGAGTSTSVDTGAGVGTGQQTDGTYGCCLNGVPFRCPNEAAFVQCIGFDIDTCMQGCSFTDTACQENCFNQWSTSTPDPSSCSQDSSVACGNPDDDNPGGCVGDWDGAQCEANSDCSSFNCVANKCYGNDPGNPCEENSDCSSFNCFGGCCYGTSAGDPCEENSDCSSFNCFGNTCQ